MLPVILLVDDSKEQLETHKKYLESRYSVVCCESGLQAVLYLQESPASLVLLDIEMPHMDGYKTLERIRHTEQGMNIPIIGLTGQNTKSAVLTFMVRGGNGYLVKPVMRENLLNYVEKFVSAEQVRGHDRNILAVDDDLNSLRMLRDCLKDNYNVTTLTSGKLAMEYLVKYKPDLILLDYQMTPYTGVSMFNMIHKMEGLENVPIGFVTGVKEKAILMEMTSLKPAGVILKPFNKPDVLVKVKDMFYAYDQVE